ncbi:MAG: M50 family metallopeptidase, partial [Saccharofermentans sp.]|nr:M50 family metallopeptidase [Saccharofermentans sp.]
QKGDTVYSLRLLPIGGACMMKGEDEAEDSEEGSFNSKSVWARIAVVAAGPVFNFILAFVCALLIIGTAGYTSSEIVSIKEGSPAAEAGLEAGDLIVKAGKTSITTFSDFQVFLSLNGGNEFTLVYERDGVKDEVEIAPHLDDDGVYRIGITGGKTYKPGFIGTITASFHEVSANITTVVKSIEMMIAGRVSRDQVTGPVGIFSIIGESYSEAAQYGAFEVFITLADLILLLSSNLGVMNLLPIPALDGGRLVFLIIEAIRGKPISRDKEGLVNTIGFVALMVLMALIFLNDMTKLIR